MQNPKMDGAFKVPGLRPKSNSRSSNESDIVPQKANEDAIESGSSSIESVANVVPIESSVEQSNSIQEVAEDLSTSSSSNGSLKESSNGNGDHAMCPPSMTPPPPVKPKEHHHSKPKQQTLAEKQAKYAEILSSLKYQPPETGAPSADSRYSFEVLKTGTIVDRVKFSKLDNKGFYVVGRVPACDLVAENPTVSRTHAILQFVKCPDGDKKKNANASQDHQQGTDKPQQTGLYIFDLNSTHGTFINKNQIFPQRYYRLHVGHVLRFGNSSRLYVLLGPSEDEEEEDEKSVTELQNEKLQKELERKRLEEQGISAKPAAGEGDDGCSWGMGEDADEESDLRENPFAINFEESESFDNPKRTLRGFFEREGYDLVYDCREKTPGQFICRINLPIDGPNGQQVFAEVDIKGKKKDAVHQAALQACQILDKYGVLRQSTTESKSKRKERDWEDQDYYSSDEDTFLDRTGSVEKKREKRMKIAGKIQEKAETYESLCEKSRMLQSEIDSLLSQISKSQSMNAGDEDVDVDDYVKYLSTGAADVKKLKSKLRELTEQQKSVTTLMNIAKPASLPAHLTSTTKFETKPAVTTTTTEEIFHPKKSEPEELKEVASSSVTVPKAEETEVNKTPPVSKITPETKLGSAQKLFGPRMPAKPLNLTKPQKSDTDTPAKAKAVVNEAATPKLKEAEAMMEEDSESSDSDEEKIEETKEAEKSKKKRNRNQRQKLSKEPKFDYDDSDPKYSTWVPPSDQRGDGRTSLNEKLGY